MRAIGAKGGSTPKLTALRRAAIEQDDSLRELARETLENALRGKAVDPAQLRAAQSLFSYRSAAPPEKQRDPASGASVGGISIGSVMLFACERHVFSQGVEDADTAKELRRLETRFSELLPAPETGEAA